MTTKKTETHPLNWYVPKNTIDGSMNAWANDPCTILYDQESEKYYSWILFRNGKGFPSNWVEMTSPDLNSWTQTEERIKEGREFFQTIYPPAAMGGSVWIDKNGDYFDKGDLIFLISMQECGLMPDKDTNAYSGNLGIEESGIAYFVSHGFGKPIYKAGVLTMKGQNPTSTDWRDPYMYETDDGLHFAISAHNRIEFWKIESFKAEDIKKVDELYVRDIGVEVPNIVRFKDNLWYISCAVQDAPFGESFQSSFWYVCKQVKNKFKVISEGRHEYGTEGYAHRVVNPWQTPTTDFAIMRSMASNWAYNTDIWQWKGGCFGTEKLTINKNKVFLAPNDTIAPFVDNGTAVYEMKANKLIKDGFQLKFDKGNFSFLLRDQQIVWNNNVETALNKWNKMGGHTNRNDDILIIFNRTLLVFFNLSEGWNAHFMLPENIIHYPIKGLAKSIV